jgi:hypothetical protein
MFGAELKPGNVRVLTTSGRGFTPEEVAVRLVERIIAVAETAPEPIRAQALAFRDQMIPVCAFYMREAIKSDRTTLFNMLRDAGHPDAAEAIRRL